MVGVLTGDARSVDYSSYVRLLFCGMLSEF